MKILKRFIAAILLMSFLAVPAVWAAEQDVESTAEYQKLMAFGIIHDDDEIVYYNNVTRGLFITYVIRCSNVSDIIDVSGVESPFSDVTRAGEERDAIVLAEQLGIINGTGDGLFRPEDNITMPEIAKILVNLLGYDEICRMSGGYPMGYVAKATELGLFDGCNFTAEGYVTKSNMVKLLMNVLESDMLYVKTIWYNNPAIIREYDKMRDENYLNYVFDIYRTVGTVSSNVYTSINGQAEVGTGEVMIDGQRYDVAETNAAELLGYSLECYYLYNEEDDTRTLLYAEPYKKNSVTFVDSADIAEGSVTAANFCYYEDGKMKNITIPKSATFIYNGGLKAISKEALCPEFGTVTLIDNDDDGLVDVIQVMEYRIIQVSGISKSSYTITDKLGGDSIELNPQNTDYDFVITKNGTPLAFESIAVGDIISYAQSEGNKKEIKYVNVSSQTVTGVLETIGDDTLIISGQEYPVDDSLISSLSVGEEGEYYLDFTGRVVAKKSTADVVYGYLNELYMESFGTVQAQIFTENNRWVILDLNSKIQFNGTNGYASTAFYQYCASMEDYRQLITYTVNADGKINRIDFAQSFPAYSEEEEAAIDGNLFRLSYTSASEYYRSGLKSLGNSICLNDSTKIFVIPKQEAGIEPDLDDFSVQSLRDMVSDQRYSNVYAYDMDEARYAKAILLLDNEKTISRRSNVMIVKSIWQAIGEDGSTVDAIEGLYNGSIIKVYTRDKGVLADLPTLGKGDIIQFSMDASGNVSMVDLCCDYTKNAEMPEVLVGSLYASGTLIGGEVYYIDHQNQRILLNQGTGKFIMGASTSVKVYVYDTQEEEITVGEFSDIEKGMYVFSRVSYYLASEIVVYK